MAEIKGGDRFERHMRELADKVQSAHTLRVGFLEGATYPDGTSVPMVAAIQNYGAPGAGIPPRPFFSNMVAQKSPGWPMRLAELLKRNNMDAAKALALMGEGIKGQLRQAIVDTNAPPLAPETIRRKGAAKPLVDTGHMLQSIDSEVS